MTQKRVRSKGGYAIRLNGASPIRFGNANDDSSLEKADLSNRMERHRPKQQLSIEYPTPPDRNWRPYGMKNGSAIWSRRPLIESKRKLTRNNTRSLIFTCLSIGRY